MRVNLAVLLTIAATQAWGQASREPGTIFRDCPDCPQMVVVPAGQFTMGSSDAEDGRENDEGPVHRVSLSRNFALERRKSRWASKFVEEMGTRRMRRGTSGRRAATPGICRNGTCGKAGIGTVLALRKASRIRSPAYRGAMPRPTWNGSRRRPAEAIACRARPSGNMPREAERRLRATGATTRTKPAATRTSRTKPPGRAVSRGPLRTTIVSTDLFSARRRDRFRPMVSASTICSAMSGNGPRIATTGAMQVHPRMAAYGAAEIADGACCVAAHGTLLLATLARPGGTGPISVLGSATAVSAPRVRSNSHRSDLPPLT